MNEATHEYSDHHAERELVLNEPSIEKVGGGSKGMRVMDGKL